MSQPTTEQPNEATPDEVLLRVALADRDDPASRRAAGELLNRYRRPVYLWCFRYVRDHEAALDMAQDVMMRAYEQMASFRGNARFSSWLFAIARNRCLNEVRRVDILEDDTTEIDSIPGRAETPERQLEDKEREDRLLTLISSTLDALEQKAIWLRCVERVPVDDITRILEISSSSGARGVLQSARRKLRAELSNPRWEDLK